MIAFTIEELLESSTKCHKGYGKQAKAAAQLNIQATKCVLRKFKSASVMLVGA